MNVLDNQCPVCRSIDGLGCKAYCDFDRDRTHFDCDVCGRFSVSRNALEDYLVRPADRVFTHQLRALLSHRIRREFDEGHAPPFISDEWVEDLIAANPKLPSPAQQASNIIQRIGDMVLSSGKRIQELPIWLWASVGAPNRQFCGDIAGQLLRSGLIQGIDASSSDDPTAILDVTLSLAGWERFEAEKKGQFSTKYGFIALEWGDPTLDAFLDEVIKPAVREIGFDLQDMRDAVRMGIIDNLMRERIRDAAFILVDLTHNNAGAYWEAGYAEGIGKPVLYLCRKTQFEERGTHFDTNHCTTVTWDEQDPTEFQKTLIATLRRSLELFEKANV